MAAKDKPAFKGFTLRNKWPSRPFPIDLLLLSIDNRQRVTRMRFKINMLEIKKKLKNRNINPKQSKKAFLKIYQQENNEKGVFLSPLC